ncbi:MAG: peptidylprolyl isomerase [Spirochaetales bacterium]|nr:peptidylprolyl isomerase [Spirochaetales bacterium]
MVVVAFVVAPLFSGIGGNGNGRLVFGSYDNNNIEYTQGSYFYSQVNMLNNMYRDQISQSDQMMNFYRYYIWSSAYQQALLYTAKTWEMDESGYALSDKGISRLIIQSGYYNDENGVFDESAYASTTVAQREEIKKSVLSSAQLSRYNGDRLYGLHRSQAQLDSLINSSPVEKKFRYVVFTSDQFPDDQVLSYGESHSDLFTSYPLSRLTTSTEEEAKKALKELNEGTKTFAEAVAAYSTDMYSTAGGEMGEVYRYSLIDELGEEKTDAVLSLNTGEYSAEALETDYGWYIYSVTGEAISPDFSDETLLSAVKNWISWNDAALIDSWVLDEAEAFVAAVKDSPVSGLNLQAAVKGYEIKTTDYFPLNWGGSPLMGATLGSSSDTFLQSASLSDDFFTTAFALENKEDISDPIILDSGIIVLELSDTRDSESRIDEYTCQNYLLQSQEEIYSTWINESELYEDHFSETYYKVFPPESTEES